MRALLSVNFVFSVVKIWFGVFMASAEIELRGHIIDSFILPRVWGAIEDAGVRFHVR